MMMGCVGRNVWASFVDVGNHSVRRSFSVRSADDAFTGCIGHVTRQPDVSSAVAGQHKMKKSSRAALSLK